MGDSQPDYEYNDYNILTNEYTGDDLTEELPNRDLKCIVVTELTDRVIYTISSNSCLDGLITIAESWVAENRDHIRPSRLDELSWDQLEHQALDFQDLLRDVEQDRRGLLNIIVDWRLNSIQAASLTSECIHDKEHPTEEDKGEEFDLSEHFISLNGMRVRLLCESENKLKNYVVRRRELSSAFMREMIRIYVIYISFHYTGQVKYGRLPAMCQSDLTYVKSLGLTI